MARRGHAPPQSPRRRAIRVEPREGGHAPLPSPSGGRQPDRGERSSGPSGPTRTPLDAENGSSSRRPRSGHTGPGSGEVGAGRPRTGGGPPSGAAARPRSGDSTRAHVPGVHSGDARAARRGKAFRPLRRALVERSEDGPARGPAREGHTGHEELALQGSVQTL
jgi:hypothetical protein